MQKFLRTLTLMALLLVPWVTQGQQTVEIGTGTSTSNQLPIGTYYNYSITEMLYTDDEIGMAGTIQSISFYYSGTAEKVLPITVYMMETDDADLSASGISLADAEEVFQGNLSVGPSAGWVTIYLDTPFPYDGTSNLLIGINKDYLYYWSGQTWTGTQMSVAMARYSQNDDNAYTLSTIPASVPSLNFRPNIQMVIVPSSGPTCEKPSTIDVANITPYAATISWTSTVGNYTLEYKKTTEDAWTVVTGLTNTTYSLSNLEPGTQYQARVKAVCGTDLESGYKTTSFTTACAAITNFPWSTNFDNYSGTTSGSTNNLPICWNHINTCSYSSYAGYPIIYNSSTYAYSGSNSLRFYSYYSSYSNYDPQDQYAILPEMSGLAGKQITLNARGYNASSSFKIGLMSDPDNLSTFVEIANQENLTTTYQEFIYNIPNNANGNYVAIMINAATTSTVGVYIDDILIDNPPSCLKPTDLAAGAITPNSITLTWTDNNAGNGTYVIMDANEVEIPASQITGLSSTGVTITGLDANTVYGFTVKAFCGGNDYSYVSSISNIRTACVYETMPWSESFDEWASKSTCWSFLSGAYNMGAGPASTNSSAWALNTSYGNYITIEGKALAMNVYSTNRYWAVTPAVSITDNNAQLSVDVAVAAWSNETPNYDENDTLAFAISTDGGATFTNLAVYDYNALNAMSASYNTINIPVVGYNGQAVRFAIFGGSSASGGDNRLVIDNVAVDMATNCKRPTALAATEIGSHSAQISWTENGEATAWVVAYKDATVEEFTEVNVSNNSYTLTGLSVETDYIVKVRPVCDDQAIKWSSEQTFTTDVACPAPMNLVMDGGFTVANDGSLSATFTWEGSANGYTVALFDHYTGDVIESSIAETTTNSYTVNGLVMDSSYYFGVVADCGNDGGSGWTYIDFHAGYCLPTNTNTDGQGITNVTFGMGNEIVNNATPKVQYGNYSAMVGAVPASMDCNVTISYATGNYPYGTIIWIDWDKDLAFEDSEIVYAKKAASGSDDLVASFNIPATTTVGNYRMRIAGADSYYDDYVTALTEEDDLEAAAGANPCMSGGTWGTTHDYTLHVTEVPSCMPVTNVVVSNVTATGATISWTDTENEATYTIYNMADNSVVADGIQAQSYELTNLTSNTAYTFAVEANCLGANGTAIQVSFTTLQQPANVPYTANFENEADNSQWGIVNGTNGWYIGDVATENGNSLYVSNDNGETNAYTITAPSVSYAFRTINFTQTGFYNCAFDWKANGEGNYDFIRVALTPVDAVLPTSYSSIGTTSLPTDWVALDGGSKLNLSDGTWMNASNGFEITAPGQYNLVIIWRNDNSMGNQPPAAIDNLSVFGKVAFEPVDLTATNITSTGATLTWTRDSRNNNTERYNVILNGATVNAQPINGNSYDVTLTPNTDYTYSVVAVNQGQTTGAEAVSIRVNEYPTETGKMVDLNYSYSFSNTNNPEVNFYYGMGATRAAEAAMTRTQTYGYGLEFTNSTSGNWPVDGPVTVTFLNHNATPVNFSSSTVEYVCPFVLERDVVNETHNGAWTWVTPEGHTYTRENHRTEALAVNQNGDVVETIVDAVKNAGNCDSIINTLQLVLHPDFAINVTDQFCQGTTYTVGTGDEAQTFTTSTQTSVTLHSVNGADSVIVLNLQLNPAPAAQINNRTTYTIDNFCDGQAMVLNARSDMTGATFQWEDQSTDAVRTVNPNGNSTYTLIAIDPTTGCQSLEPATLTVNTIMVPALTITTSADAICAGQSVTLTVSDANNMNATYRWSNNQTTNSITVTPTEMTTYTVTATSENECVVTAEQTIIVNALPTVEVSTDVAALCAYSELTLTATEVEGYNYQWNTGATTAVATVNPTVSGAYTVTVTDQNNCVNTFTTANVTVYPVYELTAARSACQEMLPITWGTQTINQAGSYDQTFQTVNSCDSLVHLTFSIEAMPTENSYAEYCEGATFTFGGEQYTATSTLTEVSYIDNSNTCPVNMVQHLTVHPVKATTVPMTVCDNYTWNLTNVQYTESGEYDATLATINGCDSVVTLALTVNYQNTGVDVQSACDSYTWSYNGETYTESTNEPVFTLNNANVFGCDSVVTLNLTVNYKTLYEDFHQVCDAMSYTWLDGQTYSLNVNVEDGIVFKTGEDLNGCDSIAQLHLVMNYVLEHDTLNWVNITECDGYYLDVVNCDNTVTRKYFDESQDVVERVHNAELNRDQIVRIHLTISNSDHQTEIVTACVPYIWEVNDQISIEVNSDTIISQELTTVSGCSLVKVLRFTAKYPTTNTTAVTLCQNGSWTDGNSVEYLAADYQIGMNEPVIWNETTNVAGCDSTDYVVFTINPVYNETAQLTFCESEFVDGELTVVNANNAEESIVLSIPVNGLDQQVNTGATFAMWHTAAGCDSIVTISYTVNPTLTEDVTVQNCYSYTWNGRDYNTLGETEDSYETVSALTGCDSTAFLHLTLTDTVIGIVVINECGEFEIDGVVYRENLDIREVSEIPAQSGCDSVTIYRHIVTPRVMRDVYVNTNIPYTWANGTTYTGSVNNIYYDATVPGGCDSILVLHLNWVNDTIVLCENELPYSGNGITISNVSVNIEEGFENGMPSDWIYVDADGDGYNWTNQYYYPTSDGDYVYEGSAHTGNAQASSASFLDYNGSLNTDNWMIMPRIPAGTNTVLSWYAGYANAAYPDTYSVLVSTTGTDIEDFTDIVFTGNSEPGVYDNGYAQHTVDLSAYAGQNIYVAFRHTDYDQYFILIDDVTLTGASIYHSGDVFNDTIIYYVVNLNTTKEDVVTACDSYTWAGNGETYTESTNVTLDGFVNSNGCDSTYVLNLTVNYHSGENIDVTACDSYTWNAPGETYTLTESGIYYDTTMNAAGCLNIDTLNLTINVTQNVDQTVTACNSYEWNNQTFTESGDYQLSFNDVNGCPADSLLHLTVNLSGENNLTVIRNEASTYYNGNYYADIREREGEDYNQPYLFDVVFAEASANGCDSIDHVTLYVTRGEVVDENFIECGDFTWERNNTTYGWISSAERQANGNALYKDITNNTYIHTGENPMVIETNEMGVATHTYVLWLNMIEANYFTYDLGTILLSQYSADSIMTVNADTLNDMTIDLRSYLLAHEGDENFSVVIRHNSPSNWYCNNVVTYTANLVYNYDTTDITLCDVTTWTDPVDGVHTVTIGAANEFDYVTPTDGWHHHVVVNVTERTDSENQLVTVCDSYTWENGNGQTYTTSGTYGWNNDEACTAETLVLTINTNPGLDTTAVACDSFTWNAPDGETYTYTEGGVKNVTFADGNNCEGTATLNLTINVNEGTSETVTACDSYTWQYMADPLTESNTYTVNYSDINNCEGVHTLNLTVNAHQDSEIADSACVSYTWVDNNNTEYTTSGDYTRSITDANECAATETLHLTIFVPEVFAREQVVFGNGITIDGQFYPAAENGVAEYTVVRDTVDANGCATTVTISLYVSQYEYLFTNKVECGSYTWNENGNGHKYRVMTAAEAAANPTALYWDDSTNAPVTEMPRHYNGNMIYVLNLTLNVPVVSEFNYDVPMSQLVNNSYTVDERTIDCNAAVTAGQTMVITKEYSMKEEFPGMYFTACDSIVRYNINVIYNYFTDDTVTLCDVTTWNDPNNVEQTVTIGATTTIEYILNSNTVNEEVHTAYVKVLARNVLADSVATICFGDSYTWAYNNVTYTQSIDTTITNDDIAFCDQQRLNLFVRSSSSYTDAAQTHCANETWTWEVPTYVFNTELNEWVAGDPFSNTYTETGEYDVTFIDANGCQATATLPLTINPVFDTTADVAACDSLYWVVRSYENGQFVDVNVNADAYTVDGEYSYTAHTALGCDSVITINLTLTASSYVEEDYWFGDGSYRYTGIHTDATGYMYTSGDYTVNEDVIRTVEEGCNIYYTINLHVGNNYTHTDAVRSCLTYTWERNGATYIRLTDDERAADSIALYKDMNADTMVYYMPTIIVDQENDFDSIYMLDLTLDAIHESEVTVEVPVYPGTLTYGDSIFDFSLANHEEGRLFENITEQREVHFNGVQYCDSIINLTINVVNNYVDNGVVDLCYTETSYSWENETIDLGAINPDTTTEYYIYSYSATDNNVNYQKVIRHPIQYTTERRVACNSYNWNGQLFTESTSAATMNFTDQYGCDSTVTLTLTINYSTDNTLGSETEPIVVCNGYEWTLGDNTVLEDKVSESGMHVYEYTTADGCVSHDTLYLTVNHSNNVEFDITSCGPYTWMNGDEVIGTFTTSGEYGHTFADANAEGCDSIVTINLTVHEIPAIIYDAPENHVCDSYEWHGMTWNGTEMVDTLFATITETSFDLTAYGYNEFGCPIEHYISAIFIDYSNGRAEVTACDSYEWYGDTYTESGVYEYTTEVSNACGNLTDSLFLTINKNSGHLETDVICNGNLPAEGFVWNGTGYYTSGEYYYNYIDLNGCSSQDTLKLTVGTVRAFNRIYVENCGPYTWDVTGETFTEVGYTEASSIVESGSSVGCDSVIFLYLTIKEQPVTEATAVICDNELPYTWRGMSLEATGMYEDFGGVHAASGCDSLFTMDLTVNERTYSNVAEVACDSYEWNGETYTESGVYTYLSTNTAGCDNIDTLNLTINYNNGHATTLAWCEEYTWYAYDNTEIGTYTESGTYTYDYFDVNGCQSVDTLNLTISNIASNTISVTACDSFTWIALDNKEVGDYNESGTYTYNYIDGCGGTETLILTIKYSTAATIDEVACDSYEWFNNTYSENGTYNHTITNVAGCDSVMTLNLVVNNSTEGELFAEACNMYTWNLNGMTYPESGDYTTTIENVAGCDSVVTLHLTIKNSDNITFDVENCASYEWNGATYYESGIFSAVYTNAQGCDSIVNLNLTILPVSTLFMDEVSACDSYYFEANDELCTESGLYIATLQNIYGCDSVVAVRLTIYNNENATETVTACDSYEWNGVVYNATGVYTYDYVSEFGCNYTDTLNLKINNSSYSSIDAETCDWYTWNGMAYNQSGEYQQSFTSANGCDSVVTLNLTINTPVANTISVSACNSYSWNNEEYTATGIYTQTFSAANGCDSVVTLNLTINSNNGSFTTLEVCDSYTWNGNTYLQSGLYTYTNSDVNGCNGTDTLLLTVWPSATSTTYATACVSYTWNGINYASTGVYNQSFTAANGCDSIATLSLTINQPKSSTMTAEACGSYTWNNETYTSSGNYQHTYTAANGCDSVVTLILTVNNAAASTTNITACDSYIWNGNLYTTSGNYSYTTTGSNGCDSVVTLALVLNQSSSSTFSMTTCGSYTWMDGQTYTASTTTPTVTLVNANGCDSVVTLNLTINQPLTGDAYASACGNYMWEGINYTVSGNYTHNYTASNGCDSIVTMHLTINQPVSSSIITTACGNFAWNGVTYTTSGTYTNNFTAANGCDSVVTLHLTINQPVASNFNVTECVSYTWEGTTYTTSGAFTHNYTAANGCDSVVTMNLTINQPVATSVIASACDSYTWDGDVYAVSGVYTHNYTAANGCDSVVTLTLTLNNSVNVIDEQAACDGFIWIDNINYTASTNTPTITLHTINGCDSIITLHLTINHSVETYDSVEVNENDMPYNYYGHTYETEGDFMISGTTVHGCDSTVYLHLSVIPSTPEAIDVTSALDDITVYPNPTRGQSTVTADDVETIEVFDLVGHMVAKFEGTNRIDISNLAAGSYTLRIKTANGTAVRRLIKK